MSAKVLVLIADDDPDVRLISRANFEFVGFDVLEASSGIEALSAIQTEDPDVVILDLSMPDMDGNEVLEFMHSEGIETPVIVISGYSRSSEISKKAMSYNPSAFLVKPFLLAELLNFTLTALGIKLDLKQARRVGIINSMWGRP